MKTNYLVTLYHAAEDTYSHTYVEAEDHTTALAALKDESGIPVYALEAPHVKIGIRSGVVFVEEITGAIEVGVHIQNYDVERVKSNF